MEAEDWVSKPPPLFFFFNYRTHTHKCFGAEAEEYKNTTSIYRSGW